MKRHLPHPQALTPGSRETAIQQATHLYPEDMQSLGLPPWASRQLYGTQNAESPDTAAQALHDQGLIPDPTVDAFWDAVKGDVETISKSKRRDIDAIDLQTHDATQALKRDRQAALGAIEMNPDLGLPRATDTLPDGRPSVSGSDARSSIGGRGRGYSDDAGTDWTSWDNAEKWRRVRATRLIQIDTPTEGEVVGLLADYRVFAKGYRTRIATWATEGQVAPVNKNAHIGDIRTTKTSIKDTLSHGFGPLKVLVIPHLDEILQNAAPYSRGEDTKKRLRFINLAHRLTFEGEQLMAFVTVQEDMNGNRTYDVEFGDEKRLSRELPIGAGAGETAHANPDSLDTTTVANPGAEVKPEVDPQATSARQKDANGVYPDASEDIGRASIGGGGRGYIDDDWSVNAQGAMDRGMRTEAQVAQRLGIPYTAWMDNRPFAGNDDDNITGVLDEDGRDIHVSDLLDISHEWHHVGKHYDEVTFVDPNEFYDVKTTHDIEDKHSAGLFWLYTRMREYPRQINRDALTREEDDQALKLEQEMSALWRQNVEPARDAFVRAIAGDADSEILRTLGDAFQKAMHEHKRTSDARTRALLEQLGKPNAYRTLRPKRNGTFRYSIGGLYTGGPAAYNKPSLHAVGTNNAGRAYGWGLYATTSREMAEGYAGATWRELANAFRIDGKAYNQLAQDDPETARLIEGYVSSAIADKRARRYTAESLKRDLERDRAWVTEYLAEPENDPANMDAYPQSKQDRLRRFQARLRSLETLLQADIAMAERGTPAVHEQLWWTNRPEGDTSHLLNWDERISEENRARVIEAVRSLGLDDEQLAEHFGKRWASTPMTGEQAYRFVTEAIRKLTDLEGDPEALASQTLAKHDVDGVVTHNAIYVAFSDEHLQVVRRWIWNDATQTFELDRSFAPPTPEQGGEAQAIADAQMRRNSIIGRNGTSFRRTYNTELTALHNLRRIFQGRFANQNRGARSSIAGLRLSKKKPIEAMTYGARVGVFKEAQQRPSNGSGIDEKRFVHVADLPPWAEELGLSIPLMANGRVLRKLAKKHNIDARSFAKLIEAIERPVAAFIETPEKNLGGKHRQRQATAIVLILEEHIPDRNGTPAPSSVVVLVNHEGYTQLITAYGMDPKAETKYVGAVNNGLMQWVDKERAKKLPLLAATALALDSFNGASGPSTRTVANPDGEVKPEVDPWESDIF